MNRLLISKSLRRLVFVLVAAGTLSILIPSLATFAVEMDENAKVLAKLDDDWSKAAATKDSDRVASFYAEDAIAYPPDEPVAVGRAAAKKIWAAYFAIPNFSISWKTVHAEVSKGGDLGFTAGTYEASFTTDPNNKLVVEKGKYLCTWKKQSDGTWKAIHDIWNTDAK